MNISLPQYTTTRVHQSASHTHDDGFEALIDSGVKESAILSDFVFAITPNGPILKSISGVAARVWSCSCLETPPSQGTHTQSHYT